MTLSMYQASAPVFRQGLTALAAILDKLPGQCAERRIDPAALLADRLAPDMYPFTRQVQLTCDTAKGFVSKLTGKEAPVHEDKETTIAELQQRIQKTIQFLSSVKAEDFKGWENRQITNPRREGKFLPGNEFALQHAVPNFYFHLTTAYAILRHNGLDIGKKDYLGELNYRPL